MESMDFKSKMFIYASMLFMSTLLIITLTVIGYYGMKVKEIETNNSKIIVSKDNQIKNLQSQNASLQKEITALKSKTNVVAKPETKVSNKEVTAAKTTKK